MDEWEHPFSTFQRSKFSSKVFIEPLVESEPITEHVDFGPWKGPQPGPVKPGVPKVYSPTGGHRHLLAYQTDIFGMGVYQRGLEEGERVREYPDHYPDPASYREREEQRPEMNLPRDSDQWSRE